MMSVAEGMDGAGRIGALGPGIDETPVPDGRKEEVGTLNSTYTDPDGACRLNTEASAGFATWVRPDRLSCTVPLFRIAAASSELIHLPTRVDASAGAPGAPGARALVTT